MHKQIVSRDEIVTIFSKIVDFWIAQEYNVCVETFPVTFSVSFPYWKQGKVTQMTIRDIAKKTGYAVSTVSRALNDHPDVSQETKRRIQEVVNECNFVPNSNARQLKAQSRNAICVIVTGTSNMFLMGILERVQFQIASEGFAAEVHYEDENANVALVAQQLVREEKPLAMIFLGGNLDDFKSHFRNIEIPCIFIATVNKEVQFDNLSMVGIDDYQAAYCAGQYLIENGHRTIAVIGGDRTTSYISQKRWQGFCSAFQQLLGKPCSDDLYYTSNFRLDAGYQTMREILQDKQRPTAVFCLSDIIAIGAMRAAHECGLRVPQDISFLGFDGIPLGRYCVPSLCSVLQPQQEMADTSVRLLLQQLKKGTAAECVTVSATLLEGESVLKL